MQLLNMLLTPFLPAAKVTQQRQGAVKAFSSAGNTCLAHFGGQPGSVVVLYSQN